MDEAILSVCNGLGAGATIDDARTSLLSRGMSEADIFLAIKAGELLLKTITEKEEEIKNKPAPFGRK